MDSCLHVVIWTCLSICFLSISSPSFGSWLRSLSRFFLHCAISLSSYTDFMLPGISHSVKILSAPPIALCWPALWHISCNTDFHVFHPSSLMTQGAALGRGWISQCEVPAWVSWAWVVGVLGCFSCFMSHLGLLQLKLTRQL